MKTFTNYAPGARGITLKSGDIEWLEPGQSVKLDPEDVVEPLPDLGAKPPAQDPDEAERVAALEAENADLKKQVAEQGDQITKLTADLEKATKPGK
jgi:small-conductance mechanosensitive channel